jgi:tetratricopeptide (TPR) repeat protein
MSLNALFTRPRWLACAPDEISTRLARLEQRARDDPRRAIRHYRRAAHLASRYDLLPSEAQNRYHLGLLLRATSAVRRAEAALSRAAEIWDDLGEHRAAGDAHLAHAGVCLMDRRVDTAQMFADKAQERYRQADALLDRPQLTRLLSAINAMRAASSR